MGGFRPFELRKAYDRFNKTCIVKKMYEKRVTNLIYTDLVNVHNETEHQHL